MTTPIPIKRSDSATLTSLQGARLVGVTYRYLPSTFRTSYIGGDGMDDDVNAVVLDLGDHGKTVITWAMAGELEGLAVFRDNSYSGVADEALDASQREAWRQHIGDSIRSIAASWHVSWEGCPESLWAVRICFTAGAIVIALGRTNPKIEYIPNELVVIFDEALARSYRPRHLNDSAWGKPI